MEQHKEGLPRDRRLCFALHGCRWQEDSSQESKAGKVKYREVNGTRQGEGGTFSCVPYTEIELLTFRASGRLWTS